MNRGEFLVVLAARIHISNGTIFVQTENKLIYYQS